MTESAYTYCGSDLEAYRPVFVAEERDGEHTPAGRFCDYACPSAYIDEEKLVYGDARSFDPEA
jgi:hypothetical protein